MKYDFISPSKRRFGNDVVDIVPIRGLLSGGPYHIPDNINEDKIYLVPIIIRTPDFDINSERAMEVTRRISTTLEKYFRIKSKIIRLDGIPLIDIIDYSIDSARKLYHKLEEIKRKLLVLGYRDKLRNIAVIVFTRSTARPLKVTPYYITKLIFDFEPVSQVITERALFNPEMSFTNIALGIFTKLGGIPWRLNELMPSTDLIIGVGRTILKHYEETNQKEVVESWMGSVAIIRSDGVFREARATIVREKEELINWIAENINRIINIFISKHLSTELNVSIHYSGKKVSREEIDRIEKVIANIKERQNVDVSVKIIHITDDIPHKFLCKDYNMYPLSGFYWISSNREAYITPMGAALVGSKVYYSFTGIPRTLKITVVKTIGSITLKEALMDSLYEIHSLTFMHLAGLNININEPISTKYSRELAYLVKSLEITSKSIGASLNATMTYDRLWFL